RSFEMDRPADAMLLVCDDLKGNATVEPRRVLFSEARVPSDKSAVGVALIGSSEATLETAGGRVVVKFPAKAKGTARFKVAIWNGSPEDAAKFASAVQGLKPDADFASLTKGGPARWTEVVTSK